MRRWSFWVVLLVMVAINAVTREFGDGVAVPMAAIGAALLLGIGRLDGLTWADIGLSRATSGRGLRVGVALIAIVAVCYAAAALSPWGDSLESSRTPDNAGTLLLAMLVIIPIQTVVWEEVAFRGVLWAHVKRDHGTRVATAVSSVLFGLWHVLPATGFAASSAAVSDNAEIGTTTTLLTVAITVVFTGLAGVLLCELRRRTGSLIAPMCLHWATNALGLLAAYSVATA